MSEEEGRRFDEEFITDLPRGAIVGDEESSELFEDARTARSSSSGQSVEEKISMGQAEAALLERMQGLPSGTFTQEDIEWLDTHKHEYGELSMRLHVKKNQGKLEKSTDLSAFNVKRMLLLLRDTGQLKQEPASPLGGNKLNAHLFKGRGRPPEPPVTSADRNLRRRQEALPSVSFTENSNPTPPEHTIPNTLISNVFFWVTVGKATGRLAVLIQAIIKEGFGKDNIERFIFTHPKMMKRWPAWGVVAGLGIAAIATTVDSIRRHRDQQEKARQERSAQRARNQYRSTTASSGNNNRTSDKAYEYKRYWYLLSTTSLFTLGARAFMLQQAVRLIASAYMGEKYSQFVGDVFSPAIGALAMPLAMLHFPSLARGLANCCSKLNTQLIESRRWYKEARPDVPWYARWLVTGCAAFAFSYLAFDASADDFADKRFSATWISLIAGWVMPVLWEALRTGIIDFRYGEPQSGNRFNFALPTVSRLSQIDFPGYVKLMSGLLTADVFRSSVQGYIGKGNSIGPRGYWVAGAVLLPFISGILTKITCAVRNCFPSTMPARLNTPPLPRLDIDMTLSMNAASGAMAGLTFGSALVLMLGSTMNMKLELAIVCSMTALAVIVPLVRSKFVSRFPKASAVSGLPAAPTPHDAKENAHLELPFQVNAFMGGWAGALIGGMLGVFFSSLGDPLKVPPVYLGLPDLMRVSDAVGAPQGAVVGALAGMFWPLLVRGGKKAVTSCGARLFSMCSNESSHVDEESLLLRGGF